MLLASVGLGILVVIVFGIVIFEGSFLCWLYRLVWAWSQSDIWSHVSQHLLVIQQVLRVLLLRAAAGSCDMPSSSIQRYELRLQEHPSINTMQADVLVQRAASAFCAFRHSSLGDGRVRRDAALASPCLPSPGAEGRHGRRQVFGAA